MSSRPRTYAQGTTVQPGKSRDEIERVLQRFGASAFAYGWDTDATSATIGFTIAGRSVRMSVPMPDRRQIPRYTATNRTRSEVAITAEWDQLVRERWRALALVVKAKLTAVEAGISTVEREFLADVVLTDEGRTVHDYVGPMIESRHQAHLRQRELEASDER